jgi:hypothetical protein
MVKRRAPSPLLLNYIIAVAALAAWLIVPWDRLP